MQSTVESFLKEETMKANKEEWLEKRNITEQDPWTFNYFKMVNVMTSRKIQGEFIPEYVIGYKYLYRWIRADNLDLRKKHKGLSKWMSLVRHSKGEYKNFPKIKKGKLKGCIGVGGLVLAKIKIGVRRKI